MSAQRIISRIEVASLAVICAVAVVIFCVAAAIKHEGTIDPFDASQRGLLYYRGLGLTRSGNWLGRIKVKVIVSWFQDGRIRTEYFYGPDGVLNRGVSYYRSGAVESVTPMSQLQDGSVCDDGLLVEFFESGRVRREEGRRPGGASVLRHGVGRTYSQDGALISERYFINDKECPKAEWNDWLKSHPVDFKYAKGT